MIADRFRFFFLILAIFSSNSLAGVFDELRGVDEETYQSFDQYWKAFQAEKRKKTRQERDQIYRMLKDGEQGFRQQEEKDLKSQLEQLAKAEDKYESQLDKADSAQDKANLIFNISKAAYLQAGILNQMKVSGSENKLKTAEMWLRQLRSNYPGYSNFSEGLYTLGMVLEDQKRLDEALIVWRQLAGDARMTLYTVKGQSRAGDLLFNRDRPDEALPFYLAARRLLESLDLPGQEVELLKLEYRVAWAAYRFGDLSQLLRSSEELLSSGRYAGPEMQAMREDALELLADGLVERGSKETVIEWVQKPNVIGQAPAVALLVMQRYVATGQYQNATYVGDWVISRFGLSAEYPSILLRQAEAYKGQARTVEFIKSLENLAMLLPKESLWRSRNARNQSLVSIMEEHALKATKAVAAYYYERGLETSNRQNYEIAASYYQNLVGFYGQSNESVLWRLREANCRYFSGQYPVAANLYLQLQTSYSLSAEQLELAMYQRVVTHEAIWRQTFTGEIEVSSTKDKDLSERLDFLNASVDDYLTKFPNSSHAMDLSLLAANANRDFSRHEIAQRYWKRVLNGKSKSNQVAAAVRGLTFSSIQKGDRQELIELLIDMLRVKDKVALNPAVISELLSVLSVSLGEHGKHLSDAGKLAEAGQLLRTVADQFRSLPERDKLLRDGAIFLAMAGHWKDVEAMCHKFQDEFPASPHRFDILYLKARSLQYQLKFTDAIQAYLHFGGLATGHSKRRDGLEKASQLAQAQGDQASHARAEELLATTAGERDEKFRHQEEAVKQYLEAGMVQDALSAAEKMRGLSTDQASRMLANLIVALVRLKTNDQNAALQSIRAVEREASGLAARGGGMKAEQVAAQANYLLGNHYLHARVTPDDTVENRLQRFNQATPFFEKSYRQDANEWAVRSRYEQSFAAIQLADDVNALAFRGQSLSPAQADRYVTIAEKLRDDARNNLNLNIALRARDPVFAGQNPWVAKSQSLLSRVESSASKSRPLESVMNYDLPRQWSH